MILKVFSVFDDAVKAYKQPFFCTTKGEALRSWTEACNDDKMPFSKHPRDYSLFLIGEYDDSMGTLIPYKVPESLGCAIEFVNKE